MTIKLILATLLVYSLVVSTVLLPFTMLIGGLAGFVIHMVLCCAAGALFPTVLDGVAWVLGVGK